MIHVRCVFGGLIVEFDKNLGPAFIHMNHILPPGRIGQRWRAIAAQQIKEIETQVAATIGADDMEALRQSLLRLLTDK